MSIFATYILIILGILLVPIQFYLVIRSARVYHFRVHLINLCFNRDKRDNIMPWINGSTWDKLNKKIATHDKMLFSFKSLILENWLMSDDIKTITGL